MRHKVDRDRGGSLGLGSGSLPATASVLVFGCILSAAVIFSLKPVEDTSSFISKPQSNFHSDQLGRSQVPAFAPRGAGEGGGEGGAMTAEGTNGTAHGAPKDRQDRKHDKKKGKKRHDEDDLDAVEEHYEHVDKRDRTERCHCETGRTKECHNGEDGQLSVKDAAVAAVCKIRQHVLQVKRARRAAKEAAGAGAANGTATTPQAGGEAGEEEEEIDVDAREHAVGDQDVMSKSNLKGYRVAREPPPKSEQEQAEEVEDAAAEAIAAISVLKAVEELLHPGRHGRADMGGENLFYTQQNHLKLREAKDPFRNETIRLLPEVPDDFHFPRCAVVGNSGVLLTSGLGAEIDQYDKVLRLNQAPATHVYEGDVGSRTDFRLLNKRWTSVYGRHHAELINADNGNTTLVSSRCNVKEFKSAATAVPKVKPGATVRMLSTRVSSHAGELLSTLRRGLQEGLDKHYRGGNAPSSGFLGIFLMLQMCGEVTAYGFSGDECRSHGCRAPYHYFFNYIDAPWLRAHPSHSFELEGVVMRALHATGRVCLVPMQSPCGWEKRQEERLARGDQKQRRKKGGG